MWPDDRSAWLAGGLKVLVPFLLHRVDQLEQLTAIDDLHKRRAGTLVAHHVQGGRVLQIQLESKVKVGVNLCRGLPSGSITKGKSILVRGGDFSANGRNDLS